jgi:hypothetical protein
MYRVFQGDSAIFRKKFLKLYWYNQELLYLMLNGYGDNGEIILKE